MAFFIFVVRLLQGELHVFCRLSHVSCLRSPIPLLVSPVSCLLSPVPVVPEGECFAPPPSSRGSAPICGKGIWFTSSDARDTSCTDRLCTDTVLSSLEEALEEIINPIVFPQADL